MNWNSALARHEAEVSDDMLEIRPAKPPPSDAAIRATMALPDWQKGAAYVRALKPCQRPAQCVDHGSGPESCRMCNPQNASAR